MLEAVHVDPIANCANGRAHGARRMLRKVSSPGHQRIFVHPHHHRAEAIADIRQGLAGVIAVSARNFSPAAIAGIEGVASGAVRLEDGTDEEAILKAFAVKP